MQVYIFRIATALIEHLGKSQTQLYQRDTSLSDDHMSQDYD